MHAEELAKEAKCKQQLLAEANAASTAKVIYLFFTFSVGRSRSTCIVKYSSFNTSSAPFKRRHQILESDLNQDLINLVISLHVLSIVFVFK